MAARVAPHGAAPLSNYIAPRMSLPSIVRLLFSLFVAVSGSPITRGYTAAEDEGPAKPPDDPEFWLYIGIAIALVLGGGAFAGLTIALMGQDEIYLQVIATSGEGAERKNATKVLKLLQRGKHWVLVTLLLSNVITNETLPIILDRSLGGGWPAVLSSTILIVIFGEIVPQSVCVRFGLPIGAAMAPIVLLLMWILSPVAWPTAKLLDYLLGKDHGTMYKKAGLKTLVTLHRTLGSSPDQRLNQDEVTIISAVLDLKDKPVGSIMTPMSDVFTLSANAVLDEPMMDMILSAGYSRIPIYEPENPGNFVGMLLVKMLITYDPEDALRVRDFSLATLPETQPGTSCLDIVNFFQEGKSHMVLVSEYPGEPYGALGVLTLEDVIEELIGEEIIDESDVFIDVHKAIRRMAPAPRFRVQRGEVWTEPEPGLHTQEEGEMDEVQDADEQQRAVRDAAHAAAGHERIAKTPRLARSVTHAAGEARGPASATPSRKASLGDELSKSPRHTTFLMRRRSSSGNREPVRVRDNEPGMREKLKALGPRNRADRPAQTRINTVKIKPGTAGVASIPENKKLQLPSDSDNVAASPSSKQDPDSERQGLLGSASERTAQPEPPHPPVGRGYGTLDRSPYEQANRTKPSPAPQPRNHSGADIAAIVPAESSQTHIETSSGFPKLVIDKINRHSPTPSPPSTPTSTPDGDLDGDENEPVGSLTQREHRERALSQVYGAKPRSSRSSSHASGKRPTARSGSITESTVELAGGMKKIVLETTSSHEYDGPDGVGIGGSDGAANGRPGEQKSVDGEGHAKRKRRKRAGKNKHHGGGAEASHDEQDGLLHG